MSRRDASPSSRGRSPSRSLRPRSAGADRVDLRPVERAHRAARQPRRGRAARHARHVPERILRDAAAALCRGGLRLSRRRPVADRRDQRQAASACSSTTSRSTCATATLARHERGARSARRRPATRGRVDLAGGPGGPRSARPGSSRSSSARSAAIRYEVEALGPAGPHRRPVDARRQRAGARRRPTIPARAAALRAPLVGEYHAHHDLEAALGHRTRGSGLRMAAAIDHVVDGPDGTGHRCGERAGPGPGHGQHRARARPDADASSSCSPTAGRAMRSMPALRDQVDAALVGGEADRLGRACCRSSATTSTTSGSAPTSRSTATTSCSRRCGSRSSRSCRPRPGPSSARSRPRD